MSKQPTDTSAVGTKTPPPTFEHATVRDAMRPGLIEAHPWMNTQSVARMMAGYNAGNPLQLTLEIQRGAHAYFYDRWWQQRAMLLYFKETLPDAASPAVRAEPTVAQTKLGSFPARR